MRSRRRYLYYLVDQDRAANNSQGIINYSLGLLSALSKRLEGESLTVLCNHANEAEVADHVSGVDSVDLHVLSTPNGAAQRIFTDQLVPLRAARRLRPAVIHFPKGFVPVIRPSHAAVVATIHDDIPLRYLRGDFGGIGARERARNLYFSTQMLWSLRRSDRVFTDSEYSAGNLSHRRPATRWPVESVGVGLPEDSGESVVPLEDREPTLLHVGSDLPHKRTPLAVEWTRRYLEAKPSGLSLVVRQGAARQAEMGSVRWEHPSTTQLGFLERVRSVRALVFSSIEEGFGLPPAEAFGVGTPAVWPRTASMPEVMGDLPGGYLPGSYPDFARALTEVLALAPDDLQRCRTSIRSRHTWEAVSARVLRSYREVAGW
jgi:glycosyltransferase involved in cell wall biosynthesis